MIIPNWDAPKNVTAFCSTREGGYSKGVYQGLNLGSHVGDDIDTVVSNRQKIEAELKMPSAPIWLNQTHSTSIATVTSSTSTILDADGCYTQTQDIVCCAMSADCLPILLCNKQGTQVAAVHAGWRGLANGIVENAVKHFTDDVIAWVGPAISGGCFEVGSEVRDLFVDKMPLADAAFIQANQSGKWLADLPLLAKQRLLNSGVVSVSLSGLCTYQNPQQFYSYRRDGVTGRQAAFIWFE